MSTLVAFLEEQSASVMLKAVAASILPRSVALKCIVFEGKQDLERNLEKKLRGWRTPYTQFLVMRDRDSEDCIQVKRRLANICSRAGHSETLVRIACGELESFYLGDLEAVSAAFGQKVSGSRQIAQHLKVDGTNRSHSFNVLVAGLKKMFGES